MLSMNGKSTMISTAPPFVLRLSKDELKVLQQNHNLYNPLGAVEENGSAQVFFLDNPKLQASNSGEVYSN